MAPCHFVKCQNSHFYEQEGNAMFGGGGGKEVKVRLGHLHKAVLFSSLQNDDPTSFYQLTRNTY